MAATSQRTAEKTAEPYQCHLPADLFPIILLNFPVKSLLRFRCVSKSWLALVDDADFARLHLNTFKNNRDESRLIVLQSGIDNQFQRDYFLHCSDTFKTISELTLSCYLGNWDPISSIDGLILLKYVNCGIIGFSSLMLWNPSIQKFHKIPPLPKIEESPRIHLQDKDIGLGYDQLANDYKHVKLIFLNRSVHSVAIYSLGSDSWKTIKFRSSSSCSIWHWSMFGFSETVNFKSSLYFVAMDGLFGFDLSREVFSSANMPDDPYFMANFFKWWKLGLADGGSSLQLFDIYSPGMFGWVLDSETMSWTKRRSYPLEDCRILYLKKNGDMLTSITRKEIFEDAIGDTVSVVADEVGSYRCETDVYKILQRQIRDSSNISQVSRYVESLILLDK